MRFTSKSTNHWRLDDNTGKVQPVVPMVAGHKNEYHPTEKKNPKDFFNDPLMVLITQPVVTINGVWTLTSNKKNEQSLERKPVEKIRAKKNTTNTATKKVSKKFVDCGSFENVTDVDHLPGISGRSRHPHMPEPDVAYIFHQKGEVEINMREINRQLEKAKKDNPDSPQVYHQIANFWRVEGNTQKSIECFRRALYLSPNNSDVLLNLARILFNLKYLDDAYELTRRSLETQLPDQNSWLQHFTLAEIYKARGLHKNAIQHFHHSLDLHPGFQPALKHVKEIEAMMENGGTVTYYTLCIIFMLVFGVLCCIVLSIDTFDNASENIKTQRHFNRAMAMRSIKLGINPKLVRMRKQCNCY